jgi:hypothetical protein
MRAAAVTATTAPADATDATDATDAADATAPHTCPPALAVFLDGAPQISTDPRFTGHRHSHTVDWDGVLAEPGWSPGQRVLITLAAALTGDGQVPPEAISAYLTGRQTDLVLAMCQAARRVRAGVA